MTHDGRALHGDGPALERALDRLFQLHEWAPSSSDSRHQYLAALRANRDRHGLAALVRHCDRILAECPGPATTLPPLFEGDADDDSDAELAGLPPGSVTPPR